MPTPTNTKLTTIIPFDLVIDTDYGLIQLIKDKYYDRNIFNGILEVADRKDLISFLYCRKNKNPLYDFVLDIDDHDTINSLYEEFMEKEYANVLKKSEPTEFYTAVTFFNKSDGAITPIIMCRNKLEESFINALCKIEDINPPLPTIIGDYDTIDITAYDPIYFKYYTDSLKCIDKLKGKNIYIANYGFNFVYEEENDKVLLPDISLLLLDQNIAKITDIYSIDPEDIPV